MDSNNDNVNQLELPPDVAPLPKNWTYKVLGDLVDQSRRISYGVVQPGTQNPQGIPIIRVNNLRQGKIITEDLKLVDPEIEQKYERTRLRGGEVLLSLVGTLGETAIVPNELAGWNVARAVAVIPGLPSVNSRWIHLCLRSPQVQHYIRTWATTTVQATFNLRDAAKLPIPMPPKEEIEVIAHILGSLDDKIELNQQMNQTLEGIARALFKSWFIDFDPVRAKLDGRQPYGMDAETAALFPNSFEDSPLGKIPKGWEIQPLDKIANFLNGLALQKYPPEDENFIPVIKIAEMRKGITENSGKASPNIDGQYIIADGEILFSWSGSLEVVIWCDGIGALNQHLFKVTSNKYPKWFFYHWVKSHLANFQAIAASKATTMGHIQRRHLTEALTVVAPQQILEVADKEMSPLLDRLIANKLENRTLSSIRDFLLPKLLSGEICVKDAEETVAEVA